MLRLARRVPATDVHAVREVMAWQRAAWLLKVFYFSHDPQWLIEACDALHEEGIALPEDWAAAEVWARSRRRRSGAPRTEAERDVRILSDVLHELRSDRFPKRLPAPLCARIAARYRVSPSNVRMIVSRGRREIDPLARRPPPKSRGRRY